MNEKLRIGILFGGRSGEHEISLLSANSILQAIDRSRYDVLPVGISREGRWLPPAASHALLSGDTTLSLQAGAETSPHPLEIINPQAPQPLDVIFPILHGTFGEDGTIQGLLELAGIAYVGSGVLGSATGMDKTAMKQLFAAAGLPQTPHLDLLRRDWTANPNAVIARIEAALAYPVFVKPANLGSSVGISKVHDRAELAPALSLAARFDRRLVVEQGVGGPGAKPRELEVAVLGNDDPQASVVGEIVPAAEFYDYDAKYYSDASVPIIPADLTPDEQQEIRSMALAAFRACDCAGLARVDFLMEPRTSTQTAAPKPRIFLNEINTMPGFTAISMFPKLWEATGLSYTALIDRLIELALERHEERRRTSFTMDDPAPSR